MRLLHRNCSNAYNPLWTAAIICKLTISERGRPDDEVLLTASLWRTSCIDVFNSRDGALNGVDIPTRKDDKFSRQWTPRPPGKQFWWTDGPKIPNKFSQYFCLVVMTATRFSTGWEDWITRNDIDGLGYFRLSSFQRNNRQNIWDN